MNIFLQFSAYKFKTMATFKQIKVLTLFLVIFLTDTSLAKNNTNVLFLNPEKKNAISSSIESAISDLEIIVTHTDNKCSGGAMGTINLIVTGGLAPYVYRWDDGTVATPNRNNLPDGIYTIVVSDANGIEKTANVTITSPQPMAVNITILDNDCFGDTKGAISTNIVGGVPPYQIRWRKNRVLISGETFNLNNLASGIYEGFVTDQNNCAISFIVSINQPQAISITETTHTNNNVNGNGFNGRIGLAVLGGTPNVLPNAAYSFLWDDGSISQNRVNLPSGIYSLTVTDTKGCKSFFSTEIKTEETVLPLAIVKFDLKATAINTVTLNWEVGNQNDISKFEIQKSDDGKTFFKIGEIQKSNNIIQSTFYKYDDKYSNNPSYYQIKQINNNGDVFLSEIKYSRTNIERTNTSFSIYPNPVIDMLNILYTANTPKLLEIIIYNLQGKKIKSFKVNSKNIISLTLTDLPSGIYILQVLNEKQILFNSKFSKN
jgi:hypothetical protein